MERKSLIIPYDDEAKSAITNLRQGKDLWQNIRKIQGYTISIFPIEFNELERLHLVDFVEDRFHILNDKKWYDMNVGLLNAKDNRMEMPFLNY